MQTYISTSGLCEMFDIKDPKFFLNRKDTDFIKNIHYIQRGNTIRWHTESIVNWWKGETPTTQFVDDVLNKVIV